MVILFYLVYSFSQPIIIVDGVEGGEGKLVDQWQKLFLNWTIKLIRNISNAIKRDLCECLHILEFLSRYLSSPSNQDRFPQDDGFLLIFMGTIDLTLTFCNHRSQDLSARRQKNVSANDNDLVRRSLPATSETNVFILPPPAFPPYRSSIYSGPRHFTGRPTYIYGNAVQLGLARRAATREKNNIILRFCLRSQRETGLTDCRACLCVWEEPWPRPEER
ncbi:hypothetical protein J6590_062723 [Homalodisca vitripennis]|nr:hypothetical protein J6590_062723 [Homalodisca vitripennis]